MDGQSALGIGPEPGGIFVTPMIRFALPRNTEFRRLAIPLVMMAGLFSAKPARAIPTFARRYQTSCTTCHILIPKLNAFGTAFRNNGYRIKPRDQARVKVPDVQLGAPAWKRVWPEAIWPGGIPGAAPVALRMFHDVVVNPGAPVGLDFVFPREFEVLAGGTAGDGISYFAELDANPGQDAGTDRISMERIFVQFDRLGGSSLANLIVGRYEIRAVPFSRFHRRLIPSDLLAMDFRSPADGLQLRRPQAGLEFWGARSGRGGHGGGEYAVGVVNGNGPVPDNNTAKDVYARLAGKFGGFGLTGANGDSAAAPPAEYWRDDSVKLGLSGYLGTGRFAGGRDRFWRLGGDIDVFIGRLNLFAVGIRGRDHFTSVEAVTRYTALSVEADYLAKPWIIAIARYDGVWRHNAAQIHRFVPGLAIAIRANVRTVVEWQAFIETSHQGVSAPSGDSLGRLRLDLAF